MLDKRRVHRPAAIVLALLMPLAWVPWANAVPTEDPIRRFDEAVARGDSATAIEAARSAVAWLRERLKDSPGDLAAALESLAIRVFQEAGGAAAEPEAEALFVEALDLRRRVFGGDSLEVARSLDVLSTFHYFLGRFDEAEAEEREALALRERRLPPGDPLVAQARDGLGTILYKQGRFAEAKPLLAAALDVFRSASPPDPGRVADSLNVLAELARSEGDLHAAEERFKEALGVLDASGREAATEPPAAATDAPDGVPWSEVRARLLNNLAGIYKDQGRYDESEELLRESLALREAAPHPDPADRATAWLNLAELARLQGKPTEAGPLYARALGLARDALGSDNPELAWFLNQAALLAQEEERYADAEALALEALDLLRRTLGDQHLMVAQALHDLGRLEQARAQEGKPGASARSSERRFREALAIRMQVYGPGHPEVALTRLALARLLVENAGPGTGVAESGADGADFADGEARSEIEAAVVILDATSAYPEARAEAHAVRGRMRWQAGQRRAAIDDLREATALIETLRPHSGGGVAARAGVFARHSAWFDLLALFLFEEGRAAEGFEAAERGRGRALLDQLQAARVDLRAAIPDPRRGPLLQREQEVRGRLAETQERLGVMRARADLPEAERARRLAALEADLAKAASEYARLHEEILSASPLWRQTGGGAPVGLAETQAGLVPSQGALLLYVLGDQEAGALLVPALPEPATYHRLIADPEAARTLGIPRGRVRSADLSRVITATVAALQRPIGGGPFATDEALLETEAGAPGEMPAITERLHALWRILAPAPLWKKVKGAEELVVLPDGPLHALPLEALVVKVGRTPSASRYWIDSGPPMRYATSAGLLRVLGARAAAGSGVVSVSDPAYARPTGERASAAGTVSASAGGMLRRLPGTARESAAVLRAFPRDGADQVLVLGGEEATEERVRAALPGRRFVHLAVHGLVDVRLGDLFAALALTPPPAPTGRTDSDGLLQLFEIYELDLASELSVLSACESHAGRQVEGEGVFALSRGFLGAGSRRVVASLWPVDDASTAYLVGELFRQIAAAEQPGEPVAFSRALRDARRAVRARAAWAGPFHWAPFVLTGAR